VYALCRHLAIWAARLGRGDEGAGQQADALKSFIQQELWDAELGLFQDAWLVRTDKRRLAFECFMPLTAGAATPDQAQQAIEQHLMNTECFLTEHPVPTVAPADPMFELRMWRGPTWNSMTYWIARGCADCGFVGAARELCERALNCSAAWFEKTGTIWEFYHPHGGSPKELQRKPDTPFNTPCPDYLGHNPLLAMARLCLA
jgi:glycogen debranching enzyme